MQYDNQLPVINFEAGIRTDRLISPQYLRRKGDVGADGDVGRKAMPTRGWIQRGTVWNRSARSKSRKIVVLANELHLISRIERLYDSDGYDDIVILIFVVKLLGTQFSGKNSV